MIATNSHLQLQQASPEMVIPSCITTGNPQINSDSNTLQYLNVNYGILQAIEKLNTEELVAVYGELFLDLWQAFKKENQWKGTLFTRNLRHLGCGVMQHFDTATIVRHQSYVNTGFSLEKAA